jgi:hypothetical protein
LDELDPESLIPKRDPKRKADRNKASQ